MHDKKHSVSFSMPILKFANNFYTIERKTNENHVGQSNLTFGLKTDTKKKKQKQINITIK